MNPVPPVSSLEDLRAIEAVPLEQRDIAFTTYALLDRAADAWPDRPAAVFVPDPRDYARSFSWSFAQLRTEVDRVAGVLAAVGVTRDDAVTVMAPNTSMLVAATLAAQAVGIVAPVNPVFDLPRVRRLLDATGSRVLIAAGPDLDPHLWQRLREGATGLGLTHLLALRPDTVNDEPTPVGEVAGVHVEYLDDLIGRVAPQRWTAPRPDDIAAYFHTGGTTGAPKIAVHTHANEATTAWGIASIGHMDERTRVVAGLPLFHVNAVMVTVLATLAAGSSALWPGSLGYRDPALYSVFWKLVERYRATGMSAVPTVYARLADVPVDADISSLTYPVVGAAPLPPAVADAFRKRTGLDLCEGYGLTEATCASSGTAPGTAEPGTVGRRLPYQQIAAASVDGDHLRLLPAGEIGELVIQGPSIFAGYLPGAGSRDAQTAGHVTDGWLRTGDLGSVDDEGRVRLTGRSKDLIIRGGHNIDPASIEGALLSHPAVQDAAAVGEPDRHAGEVPVAFVVRGAAAPTADELHAWCRQRIDEPAARPRRITEVDAIPVTEVGKPFKPALRERAAQDVVVDELAAAGLGDVTVTAAHRAGRLTIVVGGRTEDVVAATKALSGFTFAIEANTDD